MEPSVGQVALDLLKWGGGLLGIAAVKLLWDLNQKMTASLSRLESHDDRITNLEKHVEYIRQNFMARTEVLETLKRIELHLENVVLKSGSAGRRSTDSQP